MSKLATPIDDVSGHIIGGSYGMAWVTYDGRKQGRTVYPTTKGEGDAMLQEIVEEIKVDLGTLFKEIYPQQKWIFHYEGV